MKDRIIGILDFVGRIFFISCLIFVNIVIARICIDFILWLDYSSLLTAILSSAFVVVIVLIIEHYITKNKSEKKI